MLITPTSRGLYCETGDFYIDPWLPVERAVITHAHGDHARPGSAAYLAAKPGLPVLRTRLGEDAAIEGLAYGEARDIGGVKVSLHPAGHVLGSSQVRIERGGEVWVVSGDYKLDPDPTCAPFEPVRCASIGPIVVHGAVDVLNRAYRECGVRLPETRMVTDFEAKKDFADALIVAPPSAQSSPWLKRFGDYSDAFASGWMAIRGARRRRVVDQGFVLSDHADWPSLNRAIESTGAGRVFVTHGHTAPLVQWLTERGLDAHTMKTEFEGEAGAEEAGA